MANYNGIISLLSLFPVANAHIALIEHIIDETWFFHPDIVPSQVKGILALPKIPVRYSRQNVYSIPNTGKTTVRNASLNGIVNYLDPNIPGGKILIEIDYDGNKAVRDVIKTYTGHIVSRGAANTVLYHTIAHIWGNATHPYFFCMLWNVCLIPNHVAWITDKNATPGTIPYDLQELLKAISWILYNPKSLLPTPLVTLPSASLLSCPPYSYGSYLNWASSLIGAGKVHFL